MAWSPWSQSCHVDAGGLKISWWENGCKVDKNCEAWDPWCFVWTNFWRPPWWRDEGSEQGPSRVKEVHKTNSCWRCSWSRDEGSGQGWLRVKEVHKTNRNTNHICTIWYMPRALRVGSCLISLTDALLFIVIISSSFSASQASIWMPMYERAVMPIWLSGVQSIT